MGFWHSVLPFLLLATPPLVEAPPLVETPPLLATPPLVETPPLLATPPPAPGDAAYWTAGRLDDAVPVAKGPHRAGINTVRRAPAGTPRGVYVAGVPEVGTFFASTPDGNTSCTGSVVHSSGHNLVLTAGHCAYGWRKSTSHRIFVPAYVYGKDAAHQPYGYYPVKKVILEPHYNPSPSTGKATDLDFAFVVLGSRVEDRTGAFTLRTTPGYNNTVTVIGYPSSSHNPGRRAITCTVPTKRLSGYRQMSMVCAGYYDGVSGSPWIANYDAVKHTGTVIGSLGGRGGGGDDDDDDWISYSPAYGSELTSLYRKALS